MSHLLMRQLQKLVEKSEFGHEIEGGRVNGVAPKIAIEVGMFLEDGDVDAGAGEEITGHDSGGPAADDKAAFLNVGERRHEESV
jgi:hypothetical protein